MLVRKESLQHDMIIGYAARGNRTSRENNSNSILFTHFRPALNFTHHISAREVNFIYWFSCCLHIWKHSLSEMPPQQLISNTPYIIGISTHRIKLLPIHSEIVTYIKTNNFVSILKVKCNQHHGLRWTSAWILGCAYVWIDWNLILVKKLMDVRKKK